MINPGTGESPLRSTQTFLILIPEARGQQPGPVIIASIPSKAAIRAAIAQVEQHYNNAPYRAVALTHDDATAQEVLNQAGRHMPHLRAFSLALTSHNAFASVLKFSADGTVSGMENVHINDFSGPSGLERLEPPPASAPLPA